MTWDYRVMKFVDGEGTVSFMVHEVYYAFDGSLDTYTEDGCSPYGETLEELAADLKRFAEAFTKPVLTPADFNKEKVQ